jgi:gas vesicle protein
MIRVLTIAAVAALIAAPASAQSVRISTAGKTTEQLQADIDRAAKSVCRRAANSSSFPREMRASCLKATIAHAYANSGDPVLAATLPTRMAAR